MAPEGVNSGRLHISTRLRVITQRAANDRTAKFDALMHHINEGSLAASFHSLDGRKAVGVDGISKEDYAKDLDSSLAALVTNLKRLSYRSRPVREKLIPREGKPGAVRSLGIVTVTALRTA